MNPSLNSLGSPMLCKGVGGDADRRYGVVQKRYADETFVHVLPKGSIPHTRHVRGSNYNLIAVFPDRISGRAIVISGKA